MGFPACRSVPLVRSSYRSGKLWAEAMKNLGREIPAEFTGLVELASAGAARQEASAVLDRMAPENVLTPHRLSLTFPHPVRWWDARYSCRQSRAWKLQRAPWGLDEPVQDAR